MFLTQTGLTKEEIVGQGFIILIAGYETTATTLQYLTYNLTMNPDVQEKIFEEIRDNVGDVNPVSISLFTLNTFCVVVIYLGSLVR